MSNRRYYVYTKSGRKFCVEEHGLGYTDWGNYNPATRKVEKVTAKNNNNDVIDETNTKITKANGFKNICFLEKGTSALAYIEMLDKSGIERVEGANYVKYLD